METQENTPTPQNNSVKRDWMIAGGAAAGFFAILKGAGWVDDNFDFSAIFNLVDFYTVAVKVAIASALAWSIKKFVFTNTLGKDFGATFDSGWNNMLPTEKTRWILALFSALFITIMFSF